MVRSINATVTTATSWSRSREPEPCLSRAVRLLAGPRSHPLLLWLITILCTTVGETFADYLKDTSGFGPDNTAILMTAALIVNVVASVPRGGHYERRPCTSITHKESGC